jgi:hypothetical protein
MFTRTTDCVRFAILNALALALALVSPALAASCTADPDVRHWTVAGDAGSDTDISGAACAGKSSGGHVFVSVRVGLRNLLPVGAEGRSGAMGVRPGLGRRAAAASIEVGRRDQM